MKPPFLYTAGTVNIFRLLLKYLAGVRLILVTERE